MKKHTSLFYAIALMMPFITTAQSIELIWAHDHGFGANAKINATVSGSDESLYSTGYYNGTVNFDPNGVYEFDNNSHIFIQKLNYAGELAWVKNLGITDTGASGSWYLEEGTSIAADSGDNIIVTGNFNSELDFDPGTGTNILTSTGLSDFFVLKMDSDGELLWAIKIGGDNIDNAAAITTDKHDDIYVTGTFSGQVDFDPDPDNEILLDSEQFTAGWASPATFILKLDPDGNVLWAHDIPNDNKGGKPNDIVTDTESNVYITGYFTGLTDFGSDGIEGLVTGAHDSYLLKLDGEGNFDWIQVLSSTAFNIGQALTVDPSDNIYSTGQFGGSVDFDRGDEEFILSSLGYTDVFIQKLDAEGEVIWVKNIGGNASVNSYDIAIETHGEFEVFITGTFNGTTDFDPNDGVQNLSPASSDLWSHDIYFSKFSEDGDYIWAQQISNSQQSKASTIFPTSDGGVLLSGDFHNAPDFDPSDNEFIISAGGGQSAFMAKYKMCMSEIFGFDNNSLAPISAECEITTLPIPTAINGCGIHFEGTADINLPITEEGSYTVNWTYENSNGQTISQQQDLTLNFITTEISHIEDHLSAAEEGYAYQWVDCDNANAPILGATEKDFYPGIWGNFAVEITNDEGCSYLSECLNYFGIGLLENQFDSAINIYPNPTSGIVHIDLGQQYETLKITVVDILGNEVQHIAIKQSNASVFEIKAAKGWYYVEIENELGEIARTKILKN